VLLVDDEPEIRSLGRILLQGYGYRVLLADDGRAAVDLYGERQAEIDLVILDLTMPRLSGRDALRELVRINPKVAVLFTSGYTDEPLTGEETDQVYGFIGKPYRPDEFAHAVRTAIDKARRGSKPDGKLTVAEPVAAS
jgi:CheY-like chemotaxis protein